MFCKEQQQEESRRDRRFVQCLWCNLEPHTLQVWPQVDRKGEGEGEVDNGVCVERGWACA